MYVNKNNIFDSIIFTLQMFANVIMLQISDNDKYLVANDRLIINNVTESDAGRYKCTAQVIVTNEIVDKFIQVKVNFFILNEQD